MCVVILGEVVEIQRLAICIDTWLTVDLITRCTVHACCQEGKNVKNLFIYEIKVKVKKNKPLQGMALTERSPSVCLLAGLLSCSP